MGLILLEVSGIEKENFGKSAGKLRKKGLSLDGTAESGTGRPGSGCQQVKGVVIEIRNQEVVPQGRHAIRAGVGGR